MKKNILLAISAALVVALAIVSLHAWMTIGELRQGLRHMFFTALRPVPLANCRFERFGAPEDGGYLMCGNLLGEVQAAYSYGVAGRDGWACDVATKHHLTVHQYDCFDLRRTPCPGGTLVFHEECVGDARARSGKRAFDTVASQLARNGDAGKRLVVKMDVEGAELDTLLATPDEILRQIDQLLVEFHSIHDLRDIWVIEKLKRTFYVAYVHANNYACRWGEPPFSSGANEILFVNKRVAVVQGDGTAPVPPSPLALSNYPKLPECQPRWPW